MASDAACSATATGNWNDGSKWSGCSGAGGIPDATDDVTITGNVVMTLNANAVAASIIIDTAGFANGITLNGFTLTVGGGTGTIAMNA